MTRVPGFKLPSGTAMAQDGTVRLRSETAGFRPAVSVSRRVFEKVAEDSLREAVGMSALDTKAVRRHPHKRPRACNWPPSGPSSPVESLHHAATATASASAKKPHDTISCRARLRRAWDIRLAPERRGFPVPRRLALGLTSSLTRATSSASARCRRAAAPRPAVAAVRLGASHLGAFRPSARPQSPSCSGP